MNDAKMEGIMVVGSSCYSIIRLESLPNKCSYAQIGKIEDGGGVRDNKNKMYIIIRGVFINTIFYIIIYSFSSCFSLISSLQTSFLLYLVIHPPLKQVAKPHEYHQRPPPPA